MLLVKFCGNRRLEDADLLNRYPPDYMGMILSKGFRRSVGVSQAAALSARLDPRIVRVGVVVNESPQRASELAEAAKVQILQLHGQESSDYIQQLRERWHGEIWKAVRVQTQADLLKSDALGVDRLILEGYTPGQVGGTGQTADWNLLADCTLKTPWLLAGGLHAGNLKQALDTVHPMGIDVSSGTETNGIKDAEKMRQILNIIRGE